MRRLLARIFLRLTGWRSEASSKPTLDKYIVIAAPHTSNWDFPLLVAFGWLYRVRMRWLGKAALFRNPFGWLFRAFGGLPVDRTRRTNMVDQIVALLSKAKELVIVIPPEGTRRYVEYWRSGFYHAALKAGVPVVPTSLCYQRRLGDLGEPIWLSGDIGADMDRIRSFYVGKKGRFPKQQGNIRLRAEDAAE